MMKRLFFLTAILLFSIAGFTQNSNYKTSIDSLLNFLKTENAFSGRVSIQKADKVIYTGNFDKFNNNIVKYKIGSVTKVFTALLVYQLIDEGKLQLNSTIDKYFPTIKNANTITIENLLSHTSGIYNVTEWDDYYGSRANHFTRQDIVDLVNKNKPAFKPNSDCLYSNTNYILLGYIVEDITSKPYPQNIKERISDKYGLPDTYCETASNDKTVRQQSYKFNGESFVKDTDSDPSFPFAAGAIVSTNEDLGKMMYLLFDHKIITDSSLSEMKKLRSKSIGHGLMKAPFYDKIGWGHTGRIDEFRSFICYFPDDSLVLTITSDAMTLKLNEIIIGVLSIYYGRSYNYPSFPKSSVTTPGTEIFTGSYKAKLAGLITVGKLEITQAGKNYLYMNEYNDGKETEKSLLERRDAYTFYSKEAGGELTFQTDSDGKVTGISMVQGKVTIKCKKVN